MNKGLKRIALVGPAPPFRGGIALFAFHLAKAFKLLGSEIVLINFQNQYPQSIFPGGDQYDHQSSCEDIPMHRAFTPYQPWTWLKGLQLIKSFNPDLVIFSYWLPFFAPSCGWLARQLGSIPVYFLAHNIESHEKWPLSSALRSYALDAASKIVLLSQACLNDLKRYLPNHIAQKGKLAFHPIYEPIGIMKLRSAEETPTLLFYGLIKPYKGLDVLLYALSFLKKEIPNIKLIIAGAVYGDFSYYQKIIDEQQLSDYLELHLYYVSQEQTSEFFQRAQICILPYKTATQSGVIANSYSYNVPVLASNVGGLSEYIEIRKTGFLVPPNNPEAISMAITEYYQSKAFVRMQASIEELKSRYSWANLAQLILDL